MKNEFPSQFYIWGLGAVGQRALKYLTPFNVIKGIIDSDPQKQGREYFELRVFPYCKELLGEDGVIVALFNTANECERVLREDGVPYWHIINFLSEYFAKQGKPAVPFLDFPITGRCTLNCKYCMQFMPYRNDKQDFDTGSLKDSFENLLGQIDFIGEVSIIGGEPFLHKNLAEIIDCVCNPKVGSVVITTNGTVLPSAEVLEACRRNDIFVSISDYSGTLPQLKEKIDRFQTAVRDYGIACERKAQTWTDQGMFDYPVEARNNCSRTHMQLHDGKLWCCSLQAGGNSAGKCGGRESQDFVDLRKPNSAEQIMNVIRFKKTSVCAQCGSRQAQVIPVAEQMQRTQENV